MIVNGTKFKSVDSQKSSDIFFSTQFWNKKFEERTIESNRIISRIEIEIQWKFWLRPLLVSDQLYSATSFPKYFLFPSQITIFGTSVSDHLS